MFLRELEWQLEGRVKSVLIVVLAALLLICRAERQEVGPMQTAEPMQEAESMQTAVSAKVWAEENKEETEEDAEKEAKEEVEEDAEAVVEAGTDVDAGTEAEAGAYDNPIDRFFLGIEEDMPRRKRESWSLLYLDAWEGELAHAYELMGEKLPSGFFQEEGCGQRAQSAYESFVEAQGYLEEAYVNGLFPAGGRGDGLSSAAVRTELVRFQALRLYREIGAENPYVFSEEDARAIERSIFQ